MTRAFQYLSGNKFYVSSRGPGATLPYRAEEGTRIEPGDRGWGWDTAFFDYDNDGDDDMYLDNGWIEGSYAGNQKNQMFIADSGFFYLANPESAEAFRGNSRSTAAIMSNSAGSPHATFVRPSGLIERRDRRDATKFDCQPLVRDALSGESIKIQADVTKLIEDMNTSIAHADEFIKQMPK